MGIVNTLERPRREKTKFENACLIQKTRQMVRSLNWFGPALLSWNEKWSPIDTQSIRNTPPQGTRIKPFDLCNCSCFTGLYFFILTIYIFLMNKNSNMNVRETHLKTNGTRYVNRTSQLSSSSPWHCHCREHHVFTGIPTHVSYLYTRT